MVWAVSYGYVNSYNSKKKEKKKNYPEPITQGLAWMRIRYKPGMAGRLLGRPWVSPLERNPLCT